MKETPKDKRIHKNLLPGQMSIEGFLGKDKRSFSEIISTDQAVLDRLDLTTKMIADRLQYFTDTAFESYDGSIIIDQKFEVNYSSFRGKLICPFGHPGMYRKGIVTLKNLVNDIEISWTPLNIHMIRGHCFFEGKGSVHRLKPSILKDVIF
ncbi:MAG: hypothetical protein DRH89_03355 [Candidatus Cloacimonadota bacterium]|nr:MAG: hypothetical protein DRH89_03355 [Candidatus Cloacimonadota bacterium]